jgi:hypothetical protein
MIAYFWDWYEGKQREKEAAQRQVEAQLEEEVERQMSEACRLFHLADVERRKKLAAVQQQLREGTAKWAAETRVKWWCGGGLVLVRRWAGWVMYFVC